MASFFFLQRAGLSAHVVTIHHSPDIEATKCPSTEEWIKKMWYIYIHNSNMEIITLSEVIRERDKYHRVSLICGILQKK